MKLKRLYTGNMMRRVAMENGLNVGSKVVIHHRAILKDSTYITREIVNAKVVKLCPYMFICETPTGRTECYRYNEFLGDESTLVLLAK